MVRDPFREAPARTCRRPPQQFVEELAVVDDAVLAAELRVLVLDRVEAVRARRDDRLDRYRFSLDVGLGEHLVEVLVAEPPGRLARALLLVAEDGELHPRRLHELDERARHLLVALVERPVAADPVELLRLPHVVMTRTPRSSAQSARVCHDICHGLPLFSRFRNAGCSFAGKRDSVSTSSGACRRSWARAR